MEIQFYKLVAGKSDLILINLMDEVAPADELLSHISHTLCRRRSGIGANGVIFLLPGHKRQLSIRYFLSSGIESLLYAEPVLYASRYLFDMGIIGKGGLVVETTGGESEITLIDSSNFSLSLGIPRDARGRELKDYTQSEIDSYDLVYTSEYKGNVPLTLVDIGLQGAVFFREGSLKKHREFARNLVSGMAINDNEEWIPVGVIPYSSDEIRAKSWGKPGAAHPVSTAVIAGVASMIHGFSERSSLVYVRGSRFFVQWNEENSNVHISGSAEYVFTGNFFYDTDEVLKGMEG